MNPISFEYANRELQPPLNYTTQAAKEIVPLPVWSDGEQCISLWQMTWRERLSALIFGRVWLQVLSGQTQPPVALTAAQTIFEESA